ncbi:hypothetical protein TNCV_5014951 [Trichonephila clavipes]|nr:hypothetical protein TNCV_5014951 [Trichonephila clavipes]
MNNLDELSELSKDGLEYFDDDVDFLPDCVSSFEDSDSDSEIRGGIQQNRTVTCMVLKANANDWRKNLALHCDGFRGPLSDFIVDQVV